VTLAQRAIQKKTQEGKAKLVMRMWSDLSPLWQRYAYCVVGTNLNSAFVATNYFKKRR
jgi:hypothetical protein